MPQVSGTMNEEPPSLPETFEDGSQTRGLDLGSPVLYPIHCCAVPGREELPWRIILV